MSVLMVVTATVGLPIAALVLIQLVGLLIARDDILAAVPLPARSLTVPL